MNAELTYWSKEPPWIHEVPNQGTGEDAYADQPPGAMVFLLNGSQMRNHDDLFEQMAAVLRFPDYFGRNWPALRDCLEDMLWFEHVKHFLLIISDWQDVLAEAPTDRSVLKRILNEAGSTWARLGYDGQESEGVSFNTILQG